MARAVARLTPFAIAAGYFAVALSWILLSDRVLFVAGLDAGTITSVQTVKGWLFVTVTAALLYLVIERSMSGAIARQIELRQALRSQHDIIDAITDPVFILDADGRIRHVNRQTATILGRSPRELIGRQGLDFLAPDQRPLAERSLARALEGRPEAIQCRIQTTHGPQPYDIRSAPLWGEDDKVIGVIGVGRDVSAELRARELSRLRAHGLETALTQLIESIARIVEARDPYTHGHQQRVSTLSMAIGRRMGLSSERITGLGLAAMIHDLGKIAVPAEVLSKPTRLTDAERQMVREHPNVAYDILKPIDFPWPIAEIVLQHHERLDGSGYPRHLAGDRIMLEAKILAVADTVEAMASHRPYRAARGMDAALAEIAANSGTLYDPDVVAACRQAVEAGDFAIG